MFRLITRNSQSVRLVSPTRTVLGFAKCAVATKTQAPHFHTTSFLQGRKNQKLNKAKQLRVEREDEFVEHEAQTEAVTPTIDFKDAEERFQHVLEKFEKAANEIKLGRLNPRVFDNLMVTVKDGNKSEEVPFTSVALTSMKGRNFIVTMFDPLQSAAIINSIIGSGLNMSGTTDPNNKFNLRIPMPPVTQETKQNDLKQLKELYEKTKNGARGSLTGVRGEVRQKFHGSLKTHKLSDSENKQLLQLEKLYKLFADKLQDVHRKFEKSIMSPN